MRGGTAIRILLVAFTCLVVQACEKKDQSTDINRDEIRSDVAVVGDGAGAGVQNKPSSKARQISDLIDYSTMPESQLQAMSSEGVSEATQELAMRSLMDRGDVETTKKLLVAAANQGSATAINQLATISRPGSDVAYAQENRFGKSSETSLPEAYVWTRVAELRGDATARLGLLEMADSFSQSEILEMELLAVERYESIRAQYKKNTGKDLNTDTFRTDGAVEDFKASLGSLIKMKGKGL